MKLLARIKRLFAREAKPYPDPHEFGCNQFEYLFGDRIRRDRERESRAATPDSMQIT